MYHWRGSTDYTNISLTEQYWQYQCITDGAVLTISIYHWRGSTDRYINVSLTGQYWQYQCTTDGAVLTISMYHWRSSTDNTNVPLTQQYQCTTDRHSRTDTTSISATDGAVGYWQYQRTTDRLVLTMYHWPGQQYWQYHCATDCQYGTDNDNNSANAKRKSGGDILTLRMLSGKVQSRKFIAEFRLYWSGFPHQWDKDTTT